MFAQKRIEESKIYHNCYVLGHCYRKCFTENSVLNTGSVNLFFLQVCLGNGGKAIDELHSMILLTHTLVN